MTTSMNKNNLRIVMAQLNFLVGDIAGNAEKIIQATTAARDNLHADLIVFPELCLVGYPPEDLLFRPELYERIAAAMLRIKANVKNIDLIMGYPEQTVNGSYNKAVLIRDGELILNYYKHILPNYSVFDEVRYFKPGCTPSVVNVKGVPVAITICEDLWQPGPMAQAVKAGARLMVSINASPFDRAKLTTRENIMGARAREGKIPIIYVNCVGGQDELIFDGGSMVLDVNGKIIQQADLFTESLFPVDIAIDELPHIKHGVMPKPMSNEELIYKALVFGVREYIEKNHFPRAVIGLSGGIDSALTLCIAVDAIGEDRVEAVMMPSRYTSKISLEDAEKQAEALNVDYSVISIEPIFRTFLDSLREEFANYAPDTTEENLQARCRGTLLMAISNKKNAIVLAAGNKSEMGVGYATLYGDMVGGFSVLKDVPKMLVYRLAQYRNQISPVIPQRVLERAPSAELAENQKDEDALPPYPILDEILERYIERDQSIATIVKAGFDENTVKKVVKMVDRNEYKRRQAAPGVRITERGFGKDRRYPITSGFTR